MITKYFKINLVLFLVALGVSSYLIWHHYELVNGEAGFGSFCSINQTIDCDAVNASIYSEIQGVPLATVAFSYYLFAAIICIAGIASVYFQREAILLLFPLSLGSVFASLATAGISIFLLKKMCLMCFALQLTNIFTFVIATIGIKKLWGNGSNPFQAANAKRLVGFLSVGVFGFGLTHFFASQLEHKLPFEEDAFLRELRAQQPIQVDRGSSPSQGFQGEHPPIQMVEFADFQCPACGMAARQMHRLIHTYGDQVQLVFKNFPLDMTCNPYIKVRMHEHACFASRAAICANKQGKFADLYEKMFANQLELSQENIRTWIQALGMNLDQFNQCVESDETRAILQADIDQGEKLKLASTPTFFANGRRIEGVIDEQRLRSIIKELKNK